MSPDPTVKQQAYASGLRHGEHHYGVEAFLSHPMRAAARRRALKQYLTKGRDTRSIYECCGGGR